MAESTATNVDEIMAELKSLGTEQTRKTLMRHGAPEPIWGVKIGDMQPIRKRVGPNREVALALFATGVSDAQYLAGLIADETRMTKKDLQTWVEKSRWEMIGDSIVPQLTAETPHARELGLKWIRSKKPQIVSAGWSTLASLVSITGDEVVTKSELEMLIAEVEGSIHDVSDRVRFAMNSFVTCVGCYVPSLTKRALTAAKTIGKVECDMGDTACKVMSIAEMIGKVECRGSIGKLRKHARC
jgi:3-methyladenine DNA glycosylase AlkD